MIEKINGIIWGIPLILLMLFLGIYLSVRGGFFQLRKIKYILKNTVFYKEKKEKGISVLDSVWASVGSSVGVGNIVGVAAAVHLGGAGVLFWMHLSAFFGMSIKFAEILLAARYRHRHKEKSFGGPMYYMHDGAKLKILPIIFACLGIICCLLMGNAIQSAEISKAAERLGINPILSAVIFTTVSSAVCIGGMKKIGRFSTILVPLMASFYIFGALIAIILNHDKLPCIFMRIITEAFNTEKTLSGKAAFLYAAQLGFSRGMFSNEAGLGTAAISHAAAAEKNEIRQAMWGIFEVILDTFIICTLTGITVLISGESTAHEAFGKLLFGGSGFVDISVIFFAFSTIIGWQYFGSVCLGYLTEKEFGIWKFVYAAVTFFSIYYADRFSAAAWSAADCVNGLMTFINIIVLFFMSKQVIAAERNILRQN